MGTVHMETNKSDIAPLVLLPGDPLRAKYIADKFLEDARLVNTTRNMFAFTGKYKGKRITVMGSGMGMPSVGIYSYELFNYYNVNKIIRIGTCGAGSKDIKIDDTILATGAYSSGNFAYQWGKYKDHYLSSSMNLNSDIINTATDLNIEIKTGPILTSDIFDVYASIDHIRRECPIKNIKAVEMEGFGLLHVARVSKKDATILLTVVDSKYEPNKIISSEDRETKLNEMITLALESIIK